jgi:hypothetical protein
MRFLRILVAIIVILLLLFWLGFCRHRPDHHCDKGSTTAECRVSITLGDVQYSQWPDGSLALAAPLVNDGAHPAKVLKVTAISVTGGTLLPPTTLPLGVGDIAGGGQAIVRTRFAALEVPGTYALKIKGTYEDAGATKSFDVSAPLVTRAPGGAPVPAAGATVTTHHTTGLLPPAPIHNNEPNSAENRPLAIPVGPTRHPFTIAPNGTAPAKAPAPGVGGSSVTIIQDTAGDRGAPGFPPDPSTSEANAGGVVLSTSNTYLLYSVDDGKTFTQVNPTTILPSADGGLCCDQVVIYDKGTDLFFWLLQYTADASGNNRLRVAYAHPADLKANIDNWTWFDLTNATFNDSTALDYPDLALTGKFLYVSVDASDSKGANNGLLVARMPLSQMLSGGGHSISIGYMGPNENTDVTRARGGRLTQNSPSGMYWAGQKDTSDLEVFHWDDASNSVSSNVAAVNTWCQNGYVSLASDNNQWIDNTRAQGTGSVIAGAYKAMPGAHGEIWFGWDADKDGGGCAQSRTLPYVKIVRIDDTSLNSVGEYQIWNSAYAFAYPSLASAPNGDIGVAVSFGGPTSLPATTVGYLGDYTVYYVDQSALTLAFYLNASGQAVFSPPTPTSALNTRYGDMFAVRRSGPGDADFSTEGYSWQYADTTKSTSCATAPACTYRMHYEQFGRPPTPPIR